MVPPSTVVLQLMEEEYSKASYADCVEVREVLHSRFSDKLKLQQGTAGKHFLSVHFLLEAQ